MGRGLAAFAVGLGNGYLTAERQAKQDARQKADDDWQAEQRAAVRSDRQQADNLRMGLANAVKPLTAQNTTSWDTGDEVGNSGAPETFSLGDGRRFNSAATAQTAAGPENSPEGMQQRIGLAYASAGKPMEALQYQSAATGQKLNTLKLDDAVAEHANGVANRMFMDDVQKNGGDVFQTYADNITKTNNFGLIGSRGEKRITPDGKTAQIVVIGPNKEDGTPGVEKVAMSFPNDEAGQLQAHQSFMKVDPLKKITWAHERKTEAQKQANFEAELARKTENTEGLNNFRSGMIDMKQAALDAKIAADSAKTSGQPTREERLRYTSLFSDAGRRLAEANKAMATLTRGAEGMIFSAAVKRNPNGPEAQQLQELRDAIKSHGEERSLYQGMLAGSQSGMSLTPPGPGIPTEAAAKVAVNGAMGRDPAAVEREIKQTTEDLKKVTDQPSKVLLQNHLADLQGKRTAPATAPAATAQPGTKPNYSNLWK